MTTRYPNIFANEINPGDHHPREQFRMLTNDLNFQAQFRAGDIEAKLIYQKASERLVQYEKQEAAEKLAEGLKLNEIWQKNLAEAAASGKPMVSVAETMKGDLEKMTNDPAFQKKLFAGDVQAREQFDAATKAVADANTPPSLVETVKEGNST
jgi:hypothetical protein